MFHMKEFKKRKSGYKYTKLSIERKFYEIRNYRGGDDRPGSIDFHK